MNLTPRGCSNIGGELASCMEECRNRMMNFFSSWGYHPFNPAGFQLLEGLFMNLARGRRKRIIAVNTPFGEPCCMRADITVSALSYMALHHTPEEFPLRLCYAERVFSVPRPPKENLEDTQVGAELLGWEGIGSGAEILVLLLGALDALGLTESVVVLGDASIVPGLFANLPGNLADTLVEQLQEGSYFDYVKTVDGATGISPRDKNVLKELLSLKGSPDVLQSAKALFDDRTLLEPLESLVATLENMGYGGRIRIDLGFTRDLGYYDGPVFNVYATPTGGLLGGGGRYDGKLPEARFSCQAAGFGLSLRELALACVPRNREKKVMIWGGTLSPDRVLALASSVADGNDPDRRRFSIEISWKENEAEARALASNRGSTWWIHAGEGYAEELSSGRRIGANEIGGEL